MNAQIASSWKELHKFNDLLATVYKHDTGEHGIPVFPELVTFKLDNTGQLHNAEGIEPFYTIK